jgi:origin recognition complex subunit 6
MLWRVSSDQLSRPFPSAIMPTPIEQALITLVPTLNSLPQELIDLSTSLLAQSRNKASSLKPEEEIGRTYACAHIAVERLKPRLDIDKVVARPPVAPRIYKKLYGYLDAALKEPATPRTNRLKDVGLVGTPGSGRGRRSNLGTPSKTPAKSIKSAGATPSKTPASAAKSVGSVTASGRKTRSAIKAPEAKEEVFIPGSEDERQKKAAQEEEKYSSLPDQVRPMAEAVCDALDVPQAAPHVCAALSAILQLRGWNDVKPEALRSTPRSSAKKRKRISTDVDDVAAVEDSSITPASLPALLVAISLVTTFTLRNTVIDGTTYATARSSAIAALEPDAPLPKDVDTFLHASKAEGWLELPWFTTVKASTITSIPQAQTPKKNKPPARTPLHRKEKHAPRPVTKDAEMDTVMEDADAEAEEEDNDRPGAGLRSGLGTMFQDSVDWLSGERRKAYRTWEQSVRARCTEIEGQA